MKIRPRVWGAALVLMSGLAAGPSAVAQTTADWDRSEELLQPSTERRLATVSVRGFVAEYFGDAGVPGGVDYVSVPVSTGGGAELGLGLLLGSFAVAELRVGMAFAGLGDAGTLRDGSLAAVGRLGWRDWEWTPTFALGGTIGIPSHDLRGGFGALVEAGVARNLERRFSVEAGVAFRLLGYQPAGPGTRAEAYLRLALWL